MPLIQTINTLLAHPANYTIQKRSLSRIKYVVFHYTGNVGDTAENNAKYFHEAVVHSSAHYFVSEETVYQSVPDDHAAWAVGLGARKEPYFKYPPFWKKACNNNSISIEMCGSKTGLEATEKTKETACKLAADLLHKYGLSVINICRHYDITGKNCPAWAVEDPLNWLDIKLRVSRYFYGEEDDELKDTPENYNVFKSFMEKYAAEQAQRPADWEAEAMTYCAKRGYMNDGRAKSTVTRGELATVIKRIESK